MSENFNGFEEIKKGKLSESLRRRQETQSINTSDELYAHIDSLVDRYSREERYALKDEARKRLTREQDPESNRIVVNKVKGTFLHIPQEILEAIKRIRRTEKGIKKGGSKISKDKSPEALIKPSKIKTVDDIFRFFDQEMAAGRTAFKNFGTPITEIRKEIMLALAELPYNRKLIPRSLSLLIKNELERKRKEALDQQERMIVQKRIQSMRMEENNNAIRNAVNELELRIALIQFLDLQEFSQTTKREFIDRLDKVFENPKMLDTLFPQATTEPKELYEALKRLTGGDNK